jgi:hypothetical protein
VQYTAFGRKNQQRELPGSHVAAIYSGAELMQKDSNLAKNIVAIPLPPLPSVAAFPQE